MNRKYSLITITTTLLMACGTQSTESTGTSDHTNQEYAATPTPEAEVVSESATLAQSQPAMERIAAKASPALVMSDMIIEPPRIPEQNRENYAETEISPIRDVRLEPVSTFSTDVDTASYTNARRFLSQGQRPPTDAVRVEEFINYFDYQLPGPAGSEHPINIDTELSTTPWNPDTELLRVSLQTKRSDIDSLPPLNLVFLLDVSGSMNNPDKLPLMQRSFNLLVSQLRAQDHVAIAVYAGQSGVVLEPTPGNRGREINQAINQLRAGGSTHGSAGIQLAYDLAQQSFNENGINRVIIGTDGDFNVGTTSIEALKDLIEAKRQSGVFLSVLGFGTGNYNDALMEELSNHGNGQAYYIDSYQEARKLFSQQLTATLQTVAKDVKIQIEFNPSQVAEYRLIGYDNRLLNREDFNNDAVDAGEMGSGHSVTALYEIVRTHSEFRFNDPLRYQAEHPESDTASNEIAFVKTRYKKPDSQTSVLMSTPVPSIPTDSPSDTQRLSAAVAGFAEQLRNSPYLTTWNSDDGIRLLQSTLSEDRWGYRQELLQLMRNAQSMEHID